MSAARPTDFATTSSQKIMPSKKNGNGWRRARAAGRNSLAQRTLMLPNR